MKRIILLILIILNLFTLKVFAVEENIEIVLSKENPCVGDKITLNFNINSIKNLYGFEVELEYDEALIFPLANQVKVDELLKYKNYYLAINSVDQGKIKLMGTLIGRGQNIQTKGTLFKVHVKTLKEGNAKVHVNTLKLLDIEGNPIKVNYTHSLKNININKKTRKSSKSKSKDTEKQNINIQGQVNTVDKISVGDLIIHSNILCLNHTFSVDIQTILLRLTKILKN